MVVVFVDVATPELLTVKAPPAPTENVDKSKVVVAFNKVLKLEVNPAQVVVAFRAVLNCD
jgi:hypothetical protein